MKFLVAVLFLFSTLAYSQEYIGADGPTFKVTSRLKAQEFKTGLIVPPNFKEMLRAFPKLDKSKLYQGELPAKFSWKDLTPVRNQGSCGSCYAFSMAATFADVLKLKGVGDYDLSEQFIVSCQKEYYGCSGGWLEFRLYRDLGVVREADFPYVARAVNCPSDLKYHEKIKDWYFIDGNTEVPDSDLIKRVIYTWGPISVAVAVAGNFTRYDSGIYNESSSGSINHATNLVGWDDTVKPNYWVMRNSWGKNWGEDGYMRIAYGSRKIGYAATYIDYNGQFQHPTPTPEPTPTPTSTPEPTPDPSPTPNPEPIPCAPLGVIGFLLGLVGIVGVIGIYKYSQK